MNIEMAATRLCEGIGDDLLQLKKIGYQKLDSERKNQNMKSFSLLMAAALMLLAAGCNKSDEISTSTSSTSTNTMPSTNTLPSTNK
jgi:uncharacterized lipoprotein YajG